MDNKPKTFSCVDHRTAPQFNVDKVDMRLDLAPVVAAIRELSAKIESFRIELPDPDIIELSPIIHMPETPVMVSAPIVNVPESKNPDVHMTLPTPSISPTFSPIIEVTIPWWAVAVMGIVPIIVLVIDLVMRFQG